MRVILVGPPGSGKGTQAKLLAERNRLVHISTGDILREAIRAGTPAGITAKPYMEAGKMAPDDLVNEMVSDMFKRDDHPDRFILDGYPRNVPQAVAFDAILRQQFLNVTDVVVLHVDDDELFRRLHDRNRADDQEATIRHRLKEYHTITENLVPYYERQSLVREVLGEGDKEQIYSTITRALKH